MDDIFENIEAYGTPESADAFLKDFECEDYDSYFDHGDIWEMVEYDYPTNALKIVHVFEDCIRPKIREILKGEKQIPKKPLLEGDGYYDGEMVYDGWRCPNCDEYFEIDEEAYKYCPECGQQIDWTEGEEE